MFLCLEGDGKTLGESFTGSMSKNVKIQFFDS